VKPAAFEYTAPRTVDEAVAVLAAEGDRAKVLAGGQSLVPAMNMRLARPEVVVDVNRLDSHRDVRVEPDGVAIGALVRHAALEGAGAVVPGLLGGLLAETAALVGHLPIRARGTFCGSLAHADPAAEWCTLVTALGGEMVARSVRGERTLPSEAFFDTMFTTALEPDELLVEARLPLLGPTWRYGVVEFSRRAGDFALAVAVALVDLDGDHIREARVAVGGASGRPLRLTGVESILTGQAPGPELLDAAAADASRAVDPHGDLHASAAYRRQLVGVVVGRALARAVAA
jgi:carbon-monoxide dehydrogenase medium subunit